VAAHVTPCDLAAARRAAAPIVRARGYAGVDRVICADLTGDGRPELAVTFFSGGTAGDTGWAVFVSSGHGWRVAFRQLRAYKVGLYARGGDLVEVQPIYRASDPNCCPTGGFAHRSVHWNGRRFAVVRRWLTRSFRP
jgi:hypothetical protein